MATSFWQLLHQYNVVIPILQRDYAQGRDTEKARAVRDKIVDAFCDAVKPGGKPLKLDFIYGHTIEDQDRKGEQRRTFYPLDGQQRLTTLFLFHWYIAVKERHGAEAEPLLSKFTYETRHSSRVFCADLTRYSPDIQCDSISNDIINQPWFFTSWRNDPTIRSMLTMLDTIQGKVALYGLDNVWDALTSQEAPLSFYLLPMDELGLPDDLYIKMNSRGKELTDFEYVKIRFSQLLSQALADEFNHKVDQSWSDLFWDMYQEDESLDIARKSDAAFMRFLRYMTDMMSAFSPLPNQDENEFQLFKRIYADEDNVRFLFSTLDAFVDINSTKQDFFSTIFYIKTDDYAEHRTRLFFVSPEKDLLKKCVDCYDPGQRANPFSIGEQLLLFAWPHYKIVYRGA